MADDYLRGATPRRVSRRQASKLYGIGLALLDRAIHSGELPAKKLGGVVVDGELVRFRYSIAIEDLEAWFATLPDA